MSVCPSRLFSFFSETWLWSVVRNNNNAAWLVPTLAFLSFPVLGFGGWGGGGSRWVTCGEEVKQRGALIRGY